MRGKLTSFSTLIFSILRIHSLRLVTSPDYTYSKGYLGLYSALGSLLSIITCSGPSIFTLVARFTKKLRQLDQDKETSNMEQGLSSTVSQTSITFHTTLGDPSAAEKQRPTANQESMEDHTRAAVASRVPADIRGVAAFSTSPLSALIKDPESPPAHWDLTDENLVLDRARPGEDLLQPRADGMGCLTAAYWNSWALSSSIGCETSRDYFEKFAKRDTT